MSEEMKNEASNQESEELKKLLRDNLERSDEILKISQEIKRYIRWQNLWGILRLLLIAIPIILGFIYLPPLVKEVFQSYKTLLIP